MTKKKDPSELKKAAPVAKAEVKAEPEKKSKSKIFKAINSSTIGQLPRRADRTFGITI